MVRPVTLWMILLQVVDCLQGVLKRSDSPKQHLLRGIVCCTQQDDGLCIWYCPEINLLVSSATSTAQMCKIGRKECSKKKTHWESPVLHSCNFQILCNGLVTDQLLINHSLRKVEVVLHYDDSCCSSFQTLFHWQGTDQSQIYTHWEKPRVPSFLGFNKKCSPCFFSILMTTRRKYIYFW